MLSDKDVTGNVKSKPKIIVTHHTYSIDIFVMNYSLRILRGRKRVHIMDKDSIKKVRETLRLKFKLGLKNRAIGRMVNASPASISRYSSPFQQQGLSWDQLDAMSDDEINDIVYQKKILSSLTLNIYIKN